MTSEEPGAKFGTLTLRPLLRWRLTDAGVEGVHRQRSNPPLQNVQKKLTQFIPAMSSLSATMMPAWLSGNEDNRDLI
jgi:hypothetical protein